MPGLSYQHIGHDPSHGSIALWSLDESGDFKEDRRSFDEPDADWLDWSHERMFPELKPAALGRVELDRRTGTIHISEPKIGLSSQRLTRLLDMLDAKYPETRWFIFGAGYKGEPVMSALAERVMG